MDRLDEVVTAARTAPAPAVQAANNLAYGTRLSAYSVCGTRRVCLLQTDKEI